jgi:hypothetical protein
MSAQAEVRRYKVRPSVGLAGWQTVLLDAAIGAGVLDGADLDGLNTDELSNLAGALVRAQYERVDVGALIDQAREDT